MKDPSVRTKVLVRHLPPSLSQSDFFQQIDNLFGDRRNWFCYRPGKTSHKDQRFSRAYIDFKQPEDVFEFAEFFDGHVFVNEKGAQFKAIVEYAPSQRVPKSSTKKDSREGTIYKDPDYLEFLKLIAQPAEHLPSAEIQLERKEAEQAGVAKEPPIVTPLMEYVRQKRATGSGSQISSAVRKVRRRTGAATVTKRGSTSTKRVAEKKKYILKDTAKFTSRKDKSAFNPRREEQMTSSSGKDTLGNDIDSGKMKILLKRETIPPPEGMLQRQTSIGTASVSAASKLNQRRDASGRFVRSILSHNDGRQREASAVVQSQQRILGPNSDAKHAPRSSNQRSGLNSHVSNNEPSSMTSEGDRRRAPVDRIMKKDMYGSTIVSEKHEKHTRNKDRPDRGVWAPLRRAESHSSDEPFSSSVSECPKVLCDSVEAPYGEGKPDSRTGEVLAPTGPHRHPGRRGTVPSTKDDGSLNSNEGKSSKRGPSVHGAPEKQVWVQKSSSGS